MYEGCHRRKKKTSGSEKLRLKNCHQGEGVINVPSFMQVDLDSVNDLFLLSKLFGPAFKLRQCCM